MFLQRTFVAFKSLCSRRPPDQDQNDQARIILQRVRELMELTPTALAAESMATIESAPAIAAVNPYGETAYAEDPR